MKKGKIKYYIISAIILIYLFIPLVATFVFSIAKTWQATILPEGLTLKWYTTLFSDTRFLQSIERSFAVSILTLLISIVIMIPTVFIVAVYFKKFEKIISVLSIIPFTVPAVVYAVGLIKIYSSGPIVISGTIWILIGAFFVLILPYMFQGIRNSLRTVDAVKLMEAAEILNANRFQAFIHVILPNMIKGVTVSALLSFSIIFGEFALTNILAGGAYETVQIYLYNMQGNSGSISSAVVIIYFVCVLILSFVSTKINKLVTKTR
ncbi:ABC transporter permease subunit [Clostridium sp. 19966]|uniref:ABC transporter permease n=1 Tax=Clostridium sp. 19966 TaxID=2768166 RepID=UPI0028DFDDB2|nr:ABC transporter permease subunit [Clostridium sp. 19966]MDT8715991.1 ABC transporter permease subunit [Clostridium sp. 19966]